MAGGAVAAIVRRSSFIVTFPTTPVALIQASIAASIVAGVHGDIQAALIALPIMVLLTGLWQIVFGLSGLGRVIKFTPYPVFAGFVTGVGISPFIRCRHCLVSAPSPNWLQV